MVNVQIDGVWLQFPKGTRVIEACSQASKFIPRYCYHPKLSSPGNCRMCMIEMGMPKMTPDRKPVIGADGKPERVIFGAQHAQPARLQLLGARQHLGHAKVLIDKGIRQIRRISVRDLPA